MPPPDPFTDTPAQTTSVLQVQGLRFAHPGQPLLFDGFSANVPAGLTLLQGDMGSGKTSLLHLLAGDWPASAGELRLLGPAQAGLKLPGDVAAWRRQACWFDPRDAAFDDLDAAGLRAALARRWATRGDAQWHRHLAGFSLGVHASKPMYQLSTGTRRKVGLAVALGSDCALTLLDEPAAGLDAASLAWLGQALEDAAAQPGHALVVASSQPLPVAAASTITLG